MWWAGAYSWIVSTHLHVQGISEQSPLGSRHGRAQIRGELLSWGLPLVGGHKVRLYVCSFPVCPIACDE